jgi:thiol:disulfide interchange protein DsbD
MLMFTADWCGPCQSLKATVLSHPSVLDRLERKCRFRTVDLTDWNGPSAATAKHYGVDGVPTLLFVDERGREVSRYQGPRDPQYFVKWIDQHAR